MAEPVKIHVSNQKGYVWDIKDVQTLRVQHHICGVLSGTLPEMGQQNVFLGLPLVLLPEEVVLLVKQRLAVLIDEPRAHSTPSLEQHRQAANDRTEDAQRQREEYNTWAEEKDRQVQAKFGAVIEAKRAQREKAAAALAAAEGSASFEVVVPAIAEGSETTVPPVAAAASSADSSALNPIPAPSTKAPTAPADLSSIAYTITIAASSTPLPWYSTDDPLVRYDTLEEAALGRGGSSGGKTGGGAVWSYPSTGLERARCLVFEELWRRGYFMGGGLRFGGDFLVYPGDPLRYHSHFTLTVLATPETAIMPLDLVAYGRLATAVKKAHLLASWDEEGGKAEFFSLEWAAFG